MSRFSAAAILVLVSIVGFSATAEPDSCLDAIAQFKSVKGNVPNYIRTFASCISKSDGHDDCAQEFTALQSVHADFESAVSERESKCQ
jgi:hypothetical protein